MRKEPREYQQDAINSVIESMMESSDPTLLNVATGGGKSLINSYLAEWGVSQGHNVLCITSFAELVSQNAEEHSNQGNVNSVFCATLNQKKWRNNTIIATPQSLHASIKAGHQIKDKKFGLILIDEAHRVNYNDKKTVYMKIINHYRGLMPDLRICGFSGSCMRGIDKPIYGEDQFFPKLNYSISFSTLVKMGFLVPPVFGKHNKNDDLDFSNVKQNQLGNFDKKGLDLVVGDNSKTTKIIKQVLIETEESYGTFIFCATSEQCDHVMKLLPKDSSRLITGTMNDKKRMQAMLDAKNGKVKYLVNINCLTTGINLPHFDTIVYLRLTESPIFFIQSMGRGSRLSPETNKKYFTVYDYAGNCEKFGDIGDQELASAIAKINDEKKESKLDIICPKCSELNSIHDRRCRGFDENSVRCEYMFIFRECPICRHKCDVSARVCPHCTSMLVDYNKHLKLKAYQGDKTVFDVKSQLFVKHFNFKAKRNILKIVYLTSCDETISLFFDPLGTQWQQKLWKDFLIENGMPVDHPVPTNLSHILTVTCHNFALPKIIEATKEGKYFTIISRTY